jgi:hypothetical protein
MRVPKLHPCVFTFLLAAAGLLPVSTAAAQEATAPALPAPDVVMLKSGGMVRGTISEMDPQGEVVIQAVTGDVRRFQMSEVEYAGPASRMPQAQTGAAEQPVAPVNTEESKSSSETKPLIQVKAGEAPLSLAANRPNVTFHLRTASATFQGTGTGWSSGGGTSTVSVAGTTAGYTVVCTAPCEATLPTGSHRMALSLDGGGPVEDEEAVILNGPATVVGNYKSRKGTRTVGLVLGIGGLAAGTLLIVTADPSSEDRSRLWLGLGVMGASTLAWVVLGFLPDAAEIEVTPRVGGAPRPAQARKRQGLSVTPQGFVF